MRAPARRAVRGRWRKPLMPLLHGAAVATTPCPHCGAAVPVPADDVGPCPACQAQLRFVEVPERRCACGAAVGLPPGQDMVTCTCGRRMATDPRRRLVYEATCPRCRRRMPVDAEATAWRCPHCETALTLHDTV